MKLHQMTTPLQSIIFAFMVAGCYGVSDELSTFIDPAGHIPTLFWMTFIVFTSASFILVRVYPLTVRKAQMEEIYRRRENDKTNTHLFMRRMSLIIEITNRIMKTGEGPRGLPVKKNLVVPYDDVLQIWDIADRAKMETPVEN